MTPRLVTWNFPGLGPLEVETQTRILCTTWTYQLAVKGTGTVSASATVQGRNVAGGPWVDLGTMTVSNATDSGSDTLSSNAPWAEHRVRLDSISGTGAVATCGAAGR